MLRCSRSSTFLLLVMVFFQACQSRQSATSVPTAPATASSLTGQQLATAYCGSCHLYPEPALLPKSIWKHKVLPQMALRLGFMADSISPFMSLDDTQEINRVIQSGVFSGTPVLHPDDWKKIVQFYADNAPEKPIPPVAKPAVTVGLPLFNIRTVLQRLKPSLTMLRYDAPHHRILAGSAEGQLYTLNGQLHLLDSVSVGSTPTDVRSRPDGSLDVLTAGNMEPNDQLKGKWQHVGSSESLGKLTKPTGSPLIDSLGRPVAAAYGDLNQDGQEDVVLCEFGNYIGQLSWYEKRGEAYFQHPLDPVPGARRALIRDINQDGRPDIVALLTQGDEQIAVYYNDGGGRFTKQTLLRFPSVYGSSYFELVDMDKDGDLDILYTNGDNGDKSYSLKAYHGVRIFLNNGQFKFTQSLFYPLYGATQALARDFDQDGDMDVAAVSFFPNYDRQPVESFVYLENQGNLRMKAQTFPHPEQGHWLVMEAADVDQDGDDDLLLGSFYRAITPTPRPLLQQWYRDGKGILLLENQKRQPVH